MTEVELECAVYGEGTLFPVKIARNAKVSALQEAVAGILSTEQHAVPPRLLTLYLPRKDGEWLKSDSTLKPFLKRGRQDDDNYVVEMIPNWKLNKPAYFGSDFQPGEEEIQVLVELSPSTLANEFVNKRLRLSQVPVVKMIEADVPQIQLHDGMQYVTLPAEFVKICGLISDGDMMIYCRRQVNKLWEFLRNDVIVEAKKGFIYGPPGTGKSACTLSLLASLDHQEWNVVWIHLGKTSTSCLAMGTKQFCLLVQLRDFVLPRVDGKKLLICLDGFKATDKHEDFLMLILAQFIREDRLVVCSSMATWGKRNEEDETHDSIRPFFMYSWTRDEYFAAVANPYFYNKIVSKLDAPSVLEVNDDDEETISEDLNKLARRGRRRVGGLNISDVVCSDDDDDEDENDEEDYEDEEEALSEEERRNAMSDDANESSPSEEEKKKHALDMKFYYAGGSCRFMFQYGTKKVKELLEEGVESVRNKTKLVQYCGGALHTDAINRLYGMQFDVGGKTGRSPVSSYAAYLFADECGEKTIALLAARLNTSNNPSVDGHLFEWLFFASVQKRKVKLYGDRNQVITLPQANVFRFDPTKRFKKSGTMIKGSKCWLQPVAWNEGGYDAVYFNQSTGLVIFIQVTRAATHDFKMRFFDEVLHKLVGAGMTINKLEVYFVVKADQYLEFSLGQVDDRLLLWKYDMTWANGPEESHVKVLSYEPHPVQVM